MAKAKAVTRVHILAKELGVASKAIVAKCQAEDLDIKNHMSTISVGLAATIREWFSEGEHSTTMETAKRVDLKKVRVAKRKAPKKAVEESAAEEAVQVEEQPVAEDQDQGAVVVEPEIVEAVDTVEPADEEVVEPEAALEDDQRPRAVKVEPVKPEPVMPAGPMLGKPKPAKLAGPRVIRVEKIEPHEIRGRGPGRSDRAPRRDYNKPISEPLMAAGGAAPAAGAGKKKGGRDKTRGRRKEYSSTDTQPKTDGSSKRMRSRDLAERQARLAAARGETLRSKPSRRIETKSKGGPAKDVQRPEKAYISEPIMVKELSSALALRTSEIIRALMKQGVMATANQTVAVDVAEMIALEFGTELIVELKQSLQQQIEEEFKTYERNNITERPPVVTMLGHVDHGKTSLLDKIRSTSVASGEAGGITQHIGSYQVEWKGKKVTFLDTPGHEAFTAMRARGANMTDIVVLVVAADDGLMPQTIEAIHHAKAAEVEIIVALNKIDLPGVDINRIYGQLAEHDLTPAEWSGNTEIVKTSAITGQGIEELIEHLEYMAELKGYKADSEIPASGWVIEAKMTTTQGAVATVLIKEGKLKKGDVILAGNGYGRIRTLKNSFGRTIKEASSSMAVEIAGFNGVPQAGDKFLCVKEINVAKDAADENKAREREKALATRSQVTLDNLFSQIEAGKVKELNIILRADVQGSVDVLTKYLTDISTDEVKVKILHAGVGGVTEGDVVLAQASDAIIIGFNVVPDDRVKDIAETAGVDIRLYNIIYRITEELRDAMLGLLDPKFEEKILGKLLVRDTFRHSSVGTIAGCFVESGIVSKNAKLRLIRDSIVIRDKCSIQSLKHFKDDAREVKSGLECGVKIAGFDDIKAGDAFEAYEIVEMERKL